MNEVLNFISSLIAGLLLGAIFFGGLWWTVQKGLSSKRPALWFLGSLVLRTVIAVAGFYFASGGHWEMLLICLFGFFIMRRVVIRLTRLPEDRLPEEDPNQLSKETGHAY